MLNEIPQAIYLKDYRVPEFLIDQVELTFNLNEDVSNVTARLKVRKNPKCDTDPSVLELSGSHLMLESIALDGNVLQDNQYECHSEGLRVFDVPDQFTLETVTEIKPEENTALEGLYKSSGNYCTQCEAEGFRRITYFLDRPDVMAIYTTTIVADKVRYPVLLSNGNLIERGELSNNRHWAKWHDPFPKPSYLFALVAGDLVHQEDHFKTKSGRNITLRIYVEEENIDRCDHAMASLKKSMAWDEKVYGREYDLDIYMIVAVNDFNMGAMENKGLNVFNSACVLAKPETATDNDYENIQAIIAHEYFHNWSGNRVTCRDWFQLSLKEGFTVFRDQQFTADMTSKSVKRIYDVNVLRTSQFPQDAGPMAHPVRPSSYIDISNFYTVTIYNKGAEVVRMLYNLLGVDGFRKGADIYFSLYDGQAVTTDNFVSAMEEATGADLRQFRLWYDQAGTPEVKVTRQYDAAKQIYSLVFEQTCPATPGQAKKQPFHIPLALGLFDPSGEELVPQVVAEDNASWTLNHNVLEIREAVTQVQFKNLAQAPIPSLLRDFSAPVKLTIEYTDDELMFLMAHDSNEFNRWDAGQRLAMRIINGLIVDLNNNKPLAIEQGFIDAIRKIIENDELDKSLIAQALSFPNEIVIAEQQKIVDPALIHQAREFLCNQIATALESSFMAVYQANLNTQAYQFNAQMAGQRRLKNTCLYYLMRLNKQAVRQMALSQFRQANNMTDGLEAMEAIVNADCEERAIVLDEFYQTWKNDTLVIDKWFALQARSKLEKTLDDVIALTQHEAFDIKNPNKMRAVIGAFAFANPVRFHDSSGRGYEFLADCIIELNVLNPQMSARMANAFNAWKRFETQRQTMMKAQLERIKGQPDLSKDVYEIVTKTLGEA